MSVNVSLDGKDYREGSTAHLFKIGEMHRAEIADANAAAEQSEARLQVFVNGVKDYALFILDPSGNVASWNAGAERVKGYKAEEIIGKHLSVFYEPSDAKDGRPEKTLALAAQTGRAEDEGRRVRKDGSIFWANVVVAPIHDSAGVLLGFAKVTHDLTERRSLEERLSQSQKMEAIGTLAGGVAHDFNNLLSVVISYSELLADGLKDGDPMRADLDEIKGAGWRGVALTRQLLAFSRQQVLQPKVVDLTEIVAGMETMLRRLIGEDVELTAIGPPTLDKINVDPGQMEQVIMNLAVNARDAMPRGGKLTIETAEIVLDETYASEHSGVKPGPHVMLVVSDTGIGMENATQARMFEPFFTTKEIGTGTGLGLATVFGIVRQSGGAISASSEPGKGTTFKVYFPVADRAMVARAPVPSADRRSLRGSETILLVEDDEGVRIVTRTILRKYGYNVLEAHGVGDAFLLCDQDAATIHLLLTDVVMPRMSGRQLASKLITARPDLKVLYMSGYTDDAVVRHGILDATIALLQKPITPEALVRKVRDVLDDVH
jgi:two-component system, cell cycle sensor histidine kinase and response regulator CckA